LFAIIAIQCIGTASAASNFTNYRSVTCVNDIIEYNNKLWAASSGGLVCIDPRNNTQTLSTDINQFPDLNLTSLCKDSSGNLWIASASGYLCKQAPSGAYTVYNSYQGSGWNILDISAQGKYLLIGATNGFSIFDPAHGIALRNATNIDVDPKVNALAVYNDSLYVGCKDGYAVLDISGDKLLNNNYYDKTIWHFTGTSKPIITFSLSNNEVIPGTTPSELYTNDLVTTDTSMTIVHTSNNTTLCTMLSPVVKLFADNSGNLWIGTTTNYFYKKNAAGLQQYVIPGPTMSDINRVWAARNGTLWFVPPIAIINTPWWQGVESFDGSSWKLYTPSTAINFGGFGDGSDFLGLCETRDSTMWFGTSGTPIKRYMPVTNTWKRYYIDGFQCCANEIKDITIAEGDSYWGKHNAIAQDSSGVVWFGCYTNAFIVNSLVCYDPASTATPNFRRFFSTADLRHMGIVRSLCVDAAGKILVGSTDGKLLIFSHNGNPIRDSIAQYYVEKNDLSYVSGMSAGSNGITWIATHKGLFAYVSGEDSLHFISDTTVFTSVAAESDSVIWIGTQDNGLMRYSPASRTMTSIGKSEGLISNTVNDLSIDRKNGYLWVATDQGLSRFTLGYSSTPAVDNKSIIVYPNPYSLSNPRHREIIFKHCAKNTRINIYAINGTLVKSLTSDANSAYALTGNTTETTLSWTPPKNILPGTYFFVGSKPYITKKIIIIP
jgi:ligand-binding sensor domain-containing protein